MSSVREEEREDEYSKIDHFENVGGVGWEITGVGLNEMKLPNQRKECPPFLYAN